MNMNTLVFSQTKAIRCCQEIDEDHILIAGDEEIGIIHIGVNEYMDRSNIVQNPINISKLQHIYVIQTKIGYLHVFEIEDYRLNFKHFIKTTTYGFLKAVPFTLRRNEQESNCIWTVDTQEDDSLRCYSLEQGGKTHQFTFEEEKHGKGTTYFEFHQSLSQFTFFFAQQGCIIYKYSIEKEAFDKENMKLEGQMSLADETKEEVKIIYDLCYEANTQKLYAIIRNQPYVYILRDMKLEGKVQIQNGLRVIEMTVKGPTIFGRGKILGMKGQVLAKVSKDYINSVSLRADGKVIMGSTQGMEYFYHELV